MQRPTATVVARASLLLLLTLPALLAVARWALRPVQPVAEALHRSGPAALAALPFDEALTAACASVLLACCAWATGVVLLLVAEAVLVSLVSTRTTAPRRPRRLVARAADTVCPRAGRRLVLVACGVAIGAGTIAAPALAAPPGSAPGAHTASTGAPLAGLRLPDRTAGSSSAPTAGGPDSLTVTVAPGDSLWAIAARSLPRTAATAAVTARWHRIYRLNAGRVGPDPDVLLPGTPLQLPRPDGTTRKEQP